MNKHAPIKKTYVRANHANFVTKGLQKAIMLRYKLRNIFLKEKSLESKKAYNEQRNICVKMVKKTKKEHFQNISLSEITDNKKFWKTVSTLFGNKVKTNQKINLIEKYVLGNLGCKRLLKHLRNIFDQIVFIQETSRIQ